MTDNGKLCSANKLYGAVRELRAQLAERDKDIEMLKAEVKNAWAERNLVVERVRELEAKLKPQIDNGDEERRLLAEEAEDRKGE